MCANWRLEEVDFCLSLWNSDPIAVYIDGGLFMSKRKIVAFASVFGLCLAAMMLGGSLIVFFDPTSVVIWYGIVVGGIFWSHSMEDLTNASATFWGSDPLDETVK